MDVASRGHYYLKARIAYLEMLRTEFQAWFSRIMEWRHPGTFIRIRPSRGDSHLDGYRIGGSVFQVYAPREMRLGELNAKIESDFLGARDALAASQIPMEEWTFVHNDDDGLAAETTLLIDSVRARFPGTRIRLWAFPSIWGEIAQLDDEVLSEIFGPAPTVDSLEHLQFQHVRPVIEFAQRAEVPIDVPLTPPSARKLEFNQLSRETAEYLRMGRLREKLVGQYLAAHPSPGLGEEIAQGCRTRYASLRGTGQPPDMIFGELWRWVGGLHFHSPEHLAAVLAVLSYLFESCDIFENPPDE